MTSKTARTKFKLGDRVTMTRHGRHWCRYVLGRPPTTDGVVVGYSRIAFSVGIVRDGHKKRETFHMSFWKVKP